MFTARASQVFPLHGPTFLWPKQRTLPALLTFVGCNAAGIFWGTGAARAGASSIPQTKGRNPAHVASAASARCKKPHTVTSPMASKGAAALGPLSTPAPAPAPDIMEEDDGICQLCDGLESTSANPIILCGSSTEGGCGAGWHKLCLGFKQVPNYVWFCPTCSSFRDSSSACASAPKSGGKLESTSKSLAATPAAAGMGAIEQINSEPIPEKGGTGWSGAGGGAKTVGHSRVLTEETGVPDLNAGRAPIESSIKAKATTFDGGASAVGKRRSAETVVGGVVKRARAHTGHQRGKCKFCFRSFISQHALDVHLSRNRVCRLANESSTRQRKETIGYRAYAWSDVDSATGGEGRSRPPAESRQESGPRPLDLANQIISCLMQTKGAEPFNLPIDPTDHDAKQYFQIIDPASAMDFSTIKGKLTSGGYTSVHELQDDVLLIFFNCFRYYGPHSALHAQARALSKQFDEQMSERMDNVRGMGGSADAAVFEHGAQWVGQEVRVYLPKEHERISGKIEAYECVDGTAHRYRVVFLDGNQEWKSLPNAHIELVGWVKPAKEICVSAVNASGVGDAGVAVGGGAGGGVHAAGSGEGASGGWDGAEEASAIELKRAVALKGWATRRKRQMIDTGRSIAGKMSRTHDSREVRKRVPVIFKSSSLTSRAEGKQKQDSSIARGPLHSVFNSSVHVRRDKSKALRGDTFSTPANLIKGPKKHDFLQLVQELHSKAESDVFDRPADPKFVPGYYHSNALEKQRGLTAWNTSSMSFEQMAAKAVRGEYANLSAVERDFNLLVGNAVTYHAHWHMYNKQARRLYQGTLSVFDEWARRVGSYCCKTCKQHDFVHNALLICDHCCRGVHQKCFFAAGAGALQLFGQEVVHPLRGDSAFLCSRVMPNDVCLCDWHSL